MREVYYDFSKARLPRTFYSGFVKRFLDIIISGLALIVLSPVLLIISVLVRVKMGSPVIFKQERPGKDEKIFTIWKFRTMNEKRGEDGELLEAGDRLTGLGLFLRRTSLDELPEFWNVFKGDMSLIGPRPLLVKYLPYYHGREHLRHVIRPGITGLAQVNGRNYITWDERFEKDVEYVESVSFWLDVKIFFKTIKNIFVREGVASDPNEAELKLEIARQDSPQEPIFAENDD